MGVRDDAQLPGCLYWMDRGEWCSLQRENTGRPETLSACLLADFSMSHNKRITINLVIFTGEKFPKIRKHKI